MLAVSEGRSVARKCVTKRVDAADPALSIGQDLAFLYARLYINKNVKNHDRNRRIFLTGRVARNAITGR